MEDIKIGTTDRTITVFIPDPASTDGSGKTGLTHADLTVSYIRVETDNDVVVTDVTSSLSTLSALTDAHADWGVKEVSSTLCPGEYRIDLADALFATGAWYVDLYVMITTSAAAATPKKFKLVSYDPGEGVNVTHFGGSAGTFSGGIPAVNPTFWDGDEIATTAIVLAQLANSVTHGGSAAKLQLGSDSSTPAFYATSSGGDAVRFESTGGNGDALDLVANGTGSAIVATGGATGHGVSFVGGATSGNGLRATGTAGNSAAMNLIGQGSAAGLLSTGGATGDGIRAVGGATSGDGIDCLATTSGAGLRTTGAGAGNGINSSGGTSGNGFYSLGGATNGYGSVFQGQGTSPGMIILSTETGAGLQILGGATSGNGIDVTTTDGHAFSLNASGDGKSGLVIDAGTNADAVLITGAGVGGGVWIEGGATGVGVSIVGGGTSGDALSISATAGHGVIIAAAGTSKHGVFVTGGSGGTSDGVSLVAGTGGVGLRAGTVTVTGATTLTGAVSMGNTFTVTGGIVSNITGNITGNLVGTVSTLTTYTGNVPQTGDAFARLGAPAGASVSADVAAIQADLPQRFTKNTALAGFQFFMRDTADHVTGKTGLTITATRSLDGAAFGACTNAASEIGNGWYKIDLAAADLNGNAVALRFTGTGADSTNITIVTQPT